MQTGLITSISEHGSLMYNGIGIGSGIGTSISSCIGPAISSCIGLSVFPYWYWEECGAEMSQRLA